MQHSPLEQAHLEVGARMVDFAGWLMPVQYKGIREEHQAVRTSVGIFDISHMGELFITGEGAAAWLESLLTNRVSKLGIGCGQYTLLLNETAGVIDDLLIYRTQEKEFFLVINAGRCKEDVAWFQKHLPQDGSVTMRDASEALAAVAIQGPNSAELVAKLFPGLLLPKRNGIIATVNLFGNSTADATSGVAPVLASSSISIYTAGLRAGGPCHSLPAASLERGLINGGFIARTGYTGEDGFEIFLSHAEGLALWKGCIAAGAIPCGLGARDTLRLEMGYPLNGADLSFEKTPLEAGLEKFLSLDDALKPDFIGHAALKKQRAAGIKERLTPLKLLKGTDAVPPLRAHYQIYSGEQLLGEITSGALSPSLGEGIAMAYLPIAFTAPGTPLEIDIRGRRFSSVVTTLPFWKKPS